MNVRFDDVDDLLLLQRALMEARFHPRPFDPVLMGSPRLAAMHIEVVEALVASYRADGQHGKADVWEQWRRFEQRSRERAVIIDHLRRFGRTWSDLDPDRQREALGFMVAPFTASDEEIEALRRHVVEAGRADAAGDGPQTEAGP